MNDPVNEPVKYAHYREMLTRRVYPESEIVTRVVNLSREPYTLYIGRAHHMGLIASKWANPFRVGRDGPRESVILKYRSWIVGQSDLIASLHELRGQTLGCWCKPAPCHGDVLVELLAERDAALAPSHHESARSSTDTI